MDEIKNKLNIKFYSAPAYDEKYKTNCLGNKIPKENKHYTCIAYLTIYSVMKIEKKNYLQVFLEECKYKIKKNKNEQIEVEH